MSTPTEKATRFRALHDGPGAFVMVAQNFNSFGEAIINKMIAEVAQTHERAQRQASAR